MPRADWIVNDGAENSSYLDSICEESMPSEFSSPDEANVHLEVISAELYNFTDELWTHTYQSLAERRDLESLSLDQQNCLVQAASRSVEVTFDLTERIEKCPFGSKSGRDLSSMDADRFHDQCEYFSGLCEQYLNLHVAKSPFRRTFISSQTRGSVQLETPPGFSLGSGIVTCLVIIVERCRDSVIRRRCINVLQKINLRGIFDTDNLVAYLQAIVGHEEGLARQINLDLGPDLRASDIPAAASFLEVVMSPSFDASDFEFYKKEHVGLVYVTRGHGLHNKELQLGEKKIRMLLRRGVTSNGLTLETAGRSREYAVPDCHPSE
ncbi:hypothetical protein E4T44_00875 [Aureobasidium sp. EXF-8845]|nr:hypothetical protein E4T44_00875 [Aureobasidium sp. EXF-8845]KAI4857680.1 hypothetical protein E4T45_00829 [Aureobasidium sp. EXF-8846]